jgi:hypothetical protein
MKSISIILSILLLIIFGFFATACAMGPIQVAAHTASWDRETDTNVTEYYIYYRTTGTNTWNNSQRSTLIPQPSVGTVPSYDLLQLNLANGTYDICATALDTVGDESGPSNIVLYTQYIPANPANMIKK